MNTFIPSNLYFPIYINFCLFFVIFTILHTLVVKLDDKRNINFIKISGFLMLVLLIFYIGQRPVYAVFGDTVNYAFAYNNYMRGGEITNVEDYGWHLFMKFCSSLMPLSAFFTICAFIYIYPLYKISKHYFKDYWYYAFMLFVVSFSFWTYGVNGVRNGASLSLFLWGVCYSREKFVMGLFFFISIMFHKTALLPILAYLITNFYNNPRTFLKGWLFCIPLSLALGGVWIKLFTMIGFGDDRLSGYLSSQESELFAASGFRWDFLFHSMFAVFAGWYFVVKRNFIDPVYARLLNTYLICNGFWILIINANYSNRFAYLSWFMMALIVIYPLLKQQFFKNQHLMIGKVMLLYFGFTYFMNYIYYEYIRYNDINQIN